MKKRKLDNGVAHPLEYILEIEVASGPRSYIPLFGDTEEEISTVAKSTMRALRKGVSVKGILYKPIEEW